jgi:hypothetical protein
MSVSASSPKPWARIVAELELIARLLLGPWRARIVAELAAGRIRLRHCS